MEIVEYNFLEFTDKDFFQMRLAGSIPDFGYISCPKRAPFVTFCTKHGFIELLGEAGSGKLYEVKIPFRFSRMFRYNPKPVILAENNLALVTNDFRMANA